MFPSPDFYSCSVSVNVSTCRLPTVVLSMCPPPGFLGWCCQCFHCRLPRVVLSMFPLAGFHRLFCQYFHCRLPRVALSVFPPLGLLGLLCQRFHLQASFVCSINISTCRIHMVVLSISMPHTYFTASTLIFSGCHHVGSLFANEEQKKVGS